MVNKLIEASAAKEIASTLFADPILKMAVNAAVDATPGVDIVYCKGCEHWRNSWVAPDGKSGRGYCHLEDADNVIVGRWDNDYCSYGERRPNG